MDLEVKRTQEEVDEVLNFCAEQEDEGDTKYPGMTYEQGVAAGIKWLIGETKDHPTND